MMRRVNWFDFKDSEISGLGYLGRLIVAQFLFLLIIPGFWLVASTSYKRARSFDWSKESSTLVAVLMSAYVPLNISAGEFDEPILSLFSLALAILHFTLLFKNGNKENLTVFAEESSLRQKDDNLELDFSLQENEMAVIEKHIESDVIDDALVSPLSKTPVSNVWDESEKQKNKKDVVVSINKDDSVDDLLDKVLGASIPTSILTLISITTKISRPATFAVFSFRLKTEYPSIYELGKDFVDNALFKIPENFTLKEKLSNRSKAVRVMKFNQLQIMGELLDNKPLNRFDDSRVNAECILLKSTFNLEKGAAIESLNRFKIAKAIAMSYSDNPASLYMDNYIRIYQMYIDNFLD